MTTKQARRERAARRRRLPSLRLERRAAPGAASGTLIPHPQAAASTVRAISYDLEAVVEHEPATPAELKALRREGAVLWVDVVGLSDVELIRAIGEAFGLHSLALEDVVNVHQRPKAEEFEDHVFIVVRALDAAGGAATEQVSMFVGPDYLITFQERPGDCFEPVRERLRSQQRRVRGQGTDYLAYALIDSVIDNFFPRLEAYGEDIERLEAAVVAAPEPAHIERLHGLKRELLGLRRAIWPMREMVNSLIRYETPLITDSTRIYLRDCYDHAIQLMDIVETYREVASGLLDVYLSSMSAKLNEIMKVLTIIATIFIPLGFLVGLWGMNFDRASPWNMPELGWRFGYPLALGICALVGVGLVFYFRRKGWLGGKGGPPD